jgi:hypothetical protein
MAATSRCTMKGRCAAVTPALRFRLQGTAASGITRALQGRAVTPLSYPEHTL